MEDIYNDFLANVNQEFNLCLLHDMNFYKHHLPDYNKPMIQQHYLLRFFPAYLFEYKEIYSHIIKDNHIDTPFNILSLGAGCGLDYYGLELALRDVNKNVAEYVYYTGIDKIDWLYRDTLENNDCEFINCDITEATSLAREDYNIIIFPKSIGEFSGEGFNNIIECFKQSSFTEECICLVSSMRDTQHHIDSDRFKQLLNVFTTHKNYQRLDLDIDYFYFSNNAIITLDQNFVYPDEIKGFLTSLQDQCGSYEPGNINCDDICPTHINRSPILRAGHIKYQLEMLVRR